MALSGALILARWLHFEAAMVLFGSLLFALYSGERRPRPGRNVILPAAALAFVSAATWFVCTLATLSEEPTVPGLVETGREVILATSFGEVWLIRLALAALAVLAVLARSRPPLMLVAASLLLASQAWIGHAAVGEGPAKALHVGVQLVHLLAAGTWVGGLLPLGLALAEAKARPDPSARAETARLLERFSLVGTIAAALIVLTGMLNAWFILGRAPLIGGAYASLLGAKIGLVLAMLALAFLNRFRLLPRLRAGHHAVFPMLWRSVLAEQGLGVVVLAAAAALGVTSPQ